MCVNQVRRAPMRRAASTAASTLKWVVCGRRRSASSTSTSRSHSRGHETAGISLQSVR